LDADIERYTSGDAQGRLGAMAQACAAGTRYNQSRPGVPLRVAVRARASGRKALRAAPITAGEFEGFSIHAGVAVHAADKNGRECLIRYCARPALSMERMSKQATGSLPIISVTRRKGKPPIE